MHTARPTVADKRLRFRQMHQQGCFVLPNPWDVGSALWLQGQGFQALASTSAGLAWSLGRPDNGISRAQVLHHLQQLVAATDIPVNADYENGFGADVAGVTDSVALAVASGVAGLSIEDATGDPAAPLFELDVAVQRLRAARAAIDAQGGDTLLVGRAEGLLCGRPGLEEIITRLRAYGEAGADVLYAPGLKAREEITAVVQAVAPRPLNLLVGGASDFSVAEIAAMGVRRISVGGGLARAAWAGLQQAARTLLQQGRFDGLAGAASGAELNAAFRDQDS